MADRVMQLKNIPIIYYFIGISYSYQSDELYNIASQEFESQESLDIDNMDEIKSLLSKAIDMWIQYLELKPEQAWLVLHLIKDALFALDRFSEYEVILKENLKRAPNNVDMIANLSDIYSNRGESKEALDLIDSALEKDTTSLLIKIYKIKLETNRLEGSKEVVRNLDNIIKFLITDERFQVYKNKNRDRDFVWLYESSENEINEGLKV